MTEARFSSLSPSSPSSRAGALERSPSGHQTWPEAASSSTSKAWPKPSAALNSDSRPDQAVPLESCQAKAPSWHQDPAAQGDPRRQFISRRPFQRPIFSSSPLSCHLPSWPAPPGSQRTSAASQKALPAAPFPSLAPSSSRDPACAATRSKNPARPLPVVQLAYDTSLALQRITSLLQSAAHS